MSTIQTIQVNSVLLKRLQAALSGTSRDATRWALNHVKIERITRNEIASWEVTATNGNTLTQFIVSRDLIESPVDCFYLGNYNDKHLKLLLRDHKKYESMIVFEGNGKSFKHNGVIFETEVHGFPSRDSVDLIANASSNLVEIGLDLELLTKLVDSCGASHGRISIGLDPNNPNKFFKITSCDPELENVTMVLAPLKLGKLKKQVV